MSITWATALERLDLRLRHLHVIPQGVLPRIDFSTDENSSFISGSESCDACRDWEMLSNTINIKNAMIVFIFCSRLLELVSQCRLRMFSSWLNVHLLIFNLLYKIEHLPAWNYGLRLTLCHSHIWQFDKSFFSRASLMFVFSPLIKR